MKPHKANLINSLILIILGFWGAFPFIMHQTGSATSLIPIIFGILLILLNPGLKKECKIRSHIVVLLTIVILISLFMPLKGAIERTDTTAIIRIIIMMVSSLFATFTFIKSFIAARKQKS
ncbi:MAG: hypothetical protein CMP56_04945 [Flavobacteriales bacterium]|jgi:hypothetical protein|nr:hypothetical protein [Flavobacteriales bacterium]|tara:strand:+ start:395 stop:754 length:360 start_codon:yes stop_codon:yes gene_type:complete